MTDVQIEVTWKCPRCGAPARRSSFECPALCAPPPSPPPKYTGPTVVGRTHLGKLAAPVYDPEDKNWIR